MRLDFQSPKTYLVLMSCFFVGFSSFFVVKAIPLPMALGREADELEPSALLTEDIAATLPSQGQESENLDPSNPGFERPDTSNSNLTQDNQAAQPTPVGSAADLSQSQPQPVNDIVQATQIPTSVVASARQPRYEIAWADPSNYGDRFKKDINGKPATNRPIIVLHETVGSADSTISYFKNYHANDSDQASYHTMIRRNGTVVYLVPPEKRAFGAGNSVFVTQDGEKEAVKTHKQFPPSVNNFAYHISLESPPDGYGNTAAHSGYTQAQYDSLAWLIGQSTVPLNRITTHQAVDRSGSRSDPRSFQVNRLVVALQAYR